MARILSLTRLPGTLGDPVDAIVISNAKTLGEWNEDQECFRSEITKGENAIQIEIKGVDGKRYRSNVLFTNSKKDIVATCQMSGTKINLAPAKK